MRYILLTALAMLLLSGSIVQTYEQEVSREGDSRIAEDLNMNVFVKMMPKDSLDSMESACLRHSDLRCTVDADEKSIMIIRDFDPDDSHYSFSAKYGIPFIKYKLNIQKLPNDRFSDAIDEIMGSAGIPVPTSISQEPLDLTNRNESSEIAESLQNLDLEIIYIVTMPGDITSARAGNYSAEIEGSKAMFRMSNALETGKSLEIESRETNSLLIILVGGGIIMGALAVSFFKRKMVK